MSELSRELGMTIVAIADYEKEGKEKYWHLMRRLASLQLALGRAIDALGKDEYEITLASIKMEREKKE